MKTKRSSGQSTYLDGLKISKYFFLRDSPTEQPVLLNKVEKTLKRTPTLNQQDQIGNIGNINTNITKKRGRDRYWRHLHFILSHLQSSHIFLDRDFWLEVGRGQECKRSMQRLPKNFANDLLFWEPHLHFQRSEYPLTFWRSSIFAMILSKPR